MNRVTDIQQEEAIIQFVKDAAANFEKYPKHFSYGGEPTPGEYLALRWGLSNRAVLVLKVDYDFPIRIYSDAVPYVESQE